MRCRFSLLLHLICFFKKCLNVSRYFGSLQAYKNGLTPEFAYIKAAVNAYTNINNDKLRLHGRQKYMNNCTTNHGVKQIRNAQMMMAMALKSFLSL